MIQRNSFLHFLLASLTLFALAQLPVCSKSGTSPMPDTIDPGDGGQISLETPEVRFYPQDRGANVVTTTDIELFFSVDMDEYNDWKVAVAVYPEGTANPVPEGTVPEVYVTYDRYSLSGVSWQRRALAILPADVFDQGHTVRVDAIGFTSLQGVSMPEKSATFTIVQYADPVVSITPVGGDVAPASLVRLNFNLPVADSGWTVTIDGKDYTSLSPSTEKSWSGNVLTINPPGYFAPGRSIPVLTKGFKTQYGSMVFPDANVSFTTGTILDLHPITWGDSAPLAITAPLRLSFDRDVNLDCGSGDPNCGWVVDLDGAQYTKDSPEPADIQWALPRELNINHKTTGRYLQRGSRTARAGIFYDTNGYPFGNGLNPVDVAYDVKINPALSSYYPKPGDTDVSINSNIILSFDEPVKEGCVGNVVIKKEEDGTVYSFTSSWNVSRTMLTLDPADFPEKKVIRVTADGFKAADDADFNSLNFTFTPSFVPVTGVTLSAANLRIVKDRTASLTAIFTPGSPTEKTVTWTTTDPLVATVSAGNPATVTAVEKGTAVITVTTLDGSYTASCRVMVVTPRFVAVGDFGQVYYSADGSAWTKGGTVDKFLQHVVQGKDKDGINRFIAVGVQGRRAWSIDGNTWVNYEDGFTASNFHHIVSSGGKFVAVAFDGLEWMKGDGLVWGEPFSVLNNFTGIAYGSSGFVAVGYDGHIKLSSDDGATWNDYSYAATSPDLHDVTFGNGKYVAVSYADTALSSTNGTTWVENSCKTSKFMYGVAYGDSTFVAVGDKGVVSTSSDGVNWTLRRAAQANVMDTLMGVTYGNGVFVAVGGDYRRIRSTDQGVTWKDEVTGATCADTDIYCHLRGVCYGEDEPGETPYFIVAGEPIMLNDPVPDGITFPIGMNDNGDINFDGKTDGSATANISYKFVVGETEVTYRQWKEIRDWATTDRGDGKRADGGVLYVIPGTGRIGCCSETTDLHPVTEINWRDAMVWCNALTEYCNRDNVTKLDCVYYADASYIMPHRISSDSKSLDAGPGGIDNPYVNASAGGFRLLTNDEWELAARFIKDAGSDGVLSLAGEYYPGNYASGADAQVDITAVSDYDGDGVTESSANVAVYAAVFAEGTGTSPVKSKRPNAMGIYDMSGNVWEWCFDLSIYPDAGPVGGRSRRGGGWNHDYKNLPLGDRYQGWGAPYDAVADVGFRVVRTVAE